MNGSGPARARNAPPADTLRIPNRRVSAPLDKCCDHLMGGANAGETREDPFERKTVLFGVHARASVFDEHKGKAETSALACGGLDAVVCGDAGEDNGVNATGLELLLQVGAGEGTPVALGDEKVAWLKTGGRSDLRRNSGYWLVAHVERLVGGRLQEAVEIDVHIDNRSAGGAEGFSKLLGVCDDLRDRIRGGFYADGGILQINEDECGLIGVEVKCWHGILSPETVLVKSRESSTLRM